jgi:hypothetical protein
MLIIFAKIILQIYLNTNNISISFVVHLSGRMEESRNLIHLTDSYTI